MSRFSLKIKDSEAQAKELIVGFDRPLGGYFFQVFGSPDKDGEDTFIEPHEMVSDRLKILRIIEKYGDPNNKLNIGVRQAVMFHQDPEQLIGKDFEHWGRYPTQNPPKGESNAKKES